MTTKQAVGWYLCSAYKRISVRLHEIIEYEQQPFFFFFFFAKCTAQVKEK